MNTDPDNVNKDTSQSKVARIKSDSISRSNHSDHTGATSNMNQQTQEKTTPVTAKKRKATDELSQPIGKKTTASNVNAIPGLVGASNALDSLDSLKASTALNGTVLNETVLNATESNATVSNGTVLNGSNGSLGTSTATKKSLPSKQGKAVTNKSDDCLNKRKRG